MSSRKQQRSKEWGREVENSGVRELSPLWPEIGRTGSVQYVKDGVDLTDFGPDPVPIVLTKAKGPGNPLMVTLRVCDFVEGFDPAGRGVRIQSKGRATLVLNTWMKGLLRAAGIPSTRRR